MSGSQHNPNGRQSQLGSGWSPLQLQMANLLARAPQAHMASDRGVTWHTPTPPPHLYHVPAPSPPDPLQMDAMLQAMKTGSNSVFRHTATPPELYRHTPTPPDKHLMRHTPSPGDVKAGAAIPPVDLYPHLGPARDKLVRAEELLAYARVGVDLSLGSRANGATPPAPAHPASHPAPHPASPALSVRDAPTINSLIARAAPRRVDSLLERLVPSPASPAGAAPSPHSVIVHSRVAPTPSPPSSNEDSVDSTGAGGSKRKRKPERTVRVGARASPAPAPASTLAVENGDTLPLHNGPHKPPDPALPPIPAPQVAPPPDPAPAPAPHAPAPPATAPTPPSPRPNDAANSTRRKTRSGSAETIAEIAAMIAAGGAAGPVPPLAAPPLADKLEAVLASPDPADPPPPPPSAVGADKDDRLSETQSTSTGETSTAVTAAAAPRRAPAPAATATAPVDSPSEAAAPAPAPIAPPAPQASFVEVENQLEKMFAALDDGTAATATAGAASSAAAAPPPKRRKSAPARPRKGPRKKADAKPRHKEKEPPTKDAYDSGSNASSGRSRGPYIQIRGPRESPVSVTVMNAATGEEEESARGGTRRARAGAGERRTGLHASTLGLRYDACTRDATWLCAFCGRGPHADALGDLFGPYPVDTDHDEYRALDEAARRTHAAPPPAAGCEVWVHADCAVWAPGVVARGARVWGLARAVWAAAAARCRHCARAPASLACAARACSMRAHLPCARAHSWRLDEADFRALCPTHANSV